MSESRYDMFGSNVNTANNFQDNDTAKSLQQPISSPSNDMSVDRYQQRIALPNFQVSLGASFNDSRDSLVLCNPNPLNSPDGNIKSIELAFKETEKGIFLCYEDDEFPVQYRGGNEEGIFINCTKLRDLIFQSGKACCSVSGEDSVKTNQYDYFPGNNMDYEHECQGFDKDMYSPRYSSISPCPISIHDFPPGPDKNINSPHPNSPVSSATQTTLYQNPLAKEGPNSRKRRRPKVSKDDTVLEEITVFGLTIKKTEGYILIVNDDNPLHVAFQDEDDFVYCTKTGSRINFLKIKDEMGKRIIDEGKLIEKYYNILKKKHPSEQIYILANRIHEYFYGEKLEVFKRDFGDVPTINQDYEDLIAIRKQLVEKKKWRSEKSVSDHIYSM